MGYSPWGRKESNTTEATATFTSLDLDLRLDLSSLPLMLLLLSSTILDSHSDLPAVMVLCTVFLLTKKLIPLQRSSIGPMLMALTGLVTESKLLLLPAYYCLVTNVCSTLFGNPRDYRLPGSSVHGISQVRILEWVTISFSRGSSPPRYWTCVSCIAISWILYLGPQGKPQVPAWQANKPRQGVDTRNNDFVQEASRPRRLWTSVPKNHFTWVRIQAFFVLKGEEV